MNLSKEQVLGIVRHVLTFAAGIVVAKGLVEESVATELIGGILGVIAGVWSIVSKK